MVTGQHAQFHSLHVLRQWAAPPHHATLHSHMILSSVLSTPLGTIPAQLLFWFYSRAQPLRWDILCSRLSHLVLTAMPALRTHHRCPHPRPQLVPGPRFMSSLGDEPQYWNLSKPHLNASAAPLDLKCPPVVTLSKSNSVSTQSPDQKTERSLWWLRGVHWVRVNFIPQNSLSSVFLVNTGSKQESLESWRILQGGPALWQPAHRHTLPTIQHVPSSCCEEMLQVESKSLNQLILRKIILGGLP